ncbi:hypothetical protein FRC02_008452 [Tulasnella sp. 418]|nr:hypothetical protein FRC02_008452 [Tulasnella sp. 418]
MTICTIPSSPAHQHADNHGCNYQDFKSAQTISNLEGRILGVNVVSETAGTKQELEPWKWPVYSQDHPRAGELIHPSDLSELQHSKKYNYMLPCCYCACDENVTQDKACRSHIGTSGKAKGNRLYLTCHLFNGATARYQRELKESGRDPGRFRIAVTCGFYVELSQVYTFLTTGVTDLSDSTTSEDYDSTRSSSTPQKKGSIAGQTHPKSSPFSHSQAPFTQRTSMSVRAPLKRARYGFRSEESDLTNEAPTPPSSQPLVGMAGAIELRQYDNPTPTKSSPLKGKNKVTKSKDLPPSYDAKTDWMNQMLDPREQKPPKRPNFNMEFTSSATTTPTGPFPKSTKPPAVKTPTEVEIASASATRLLSLLSSMSPSVIELAKAIDSPAGLTVEGFATQLWRCPNCDVIMMVERRTEHEGTVYCGSIGSSGV